MLYLCYNSHSSSVLWRSPHQTPYTRRASRTPLIFFHTALHTGPRSGCPRPISMTHVREHRSDHIPHCTLIHTRTHARGVLRQHNAFEAVASLFQISHACFIQATRRLLRRKRYRPGAVRNGCIGGCSMLHCCCKFAWKSARKLAALLSSLFRIKLCAASSRALMPRRRGGSFEVYDRRGTDDENDGERRSGSNGTPIGPRRPRLAQYMEPESDLRPELSLNEWLPYGE